MNARLSIQHNKHKHTILGESEFQALMPLITLLVNGQLKSFKPLSIDVGMFSMIAA